MAWTSIWTNMVVYRQYNCMREHQSLHTSTCFWPFFLSYLASSRIPGHTSCWTSLAMCPVTGKSNLLYSTAAMRMLLLNAHICTGMTTWDKTFKSRSSGMKRCNGNHLIWWLIWLTETLPILLFWFQLTRLAIAEWEIRKAFTQE